MLIPFFLRLLALLVLVSSFGCVDDMHKAPMNKKLSKSRRSSGGISLDAAVGAAAEGPVQC